VQGPWQRASSNTGHGSLARMLGGFGLGCGVLWVGSGAVMAVGVVQEEERQRGGVLGTFLFFPPLLTARVGAEGAGLDRGIVHEHGYRHGTNGDSDLHSNHDFLDFCLPGVCLNARKKFKFEFLKIFTLGDQHISQGFQRYFCYQERLSFAEIIIQILVLSLFQIQSLADV
jgi:hypothetical protein